MKGEVDELLYPNLNPLEDADFLIILQRLADRLARGTEKHEAKALRDALDSLDVDWTLLTSAAADRLIEGARAVLAGSADKIITRSSPIFTAAARAIIPGTRAAAIERHTLNIGAALSEPDKETGAALIRQQQLYIRDEYGRRADAAAARARKIVAYGIERGLGQEQMAEQLAGDITLRHLGRSRAYWEVVATAFSNRARTTVQLNAFEEAGFLKFQFVAVLDERTTDICRYLDGRIFNVPKALARIRRAEKLGSADDIKEVLPWVARGYGDNGAYLYYERSGVRHRVANVDESAVGVRDATGIFSSGLSDQQLEAAGVHVPPLHAHCRSTIVPAE